MHQALEGFELQEKTRKLEDKFGSEKVRYERYCVGICDVKRIEIALSFYVHQKISQWSKNETLEKRYRLYKPVTTETKNFRS